MSEEVTRSTPSPRPANRDVIVGAVTSVEQAFTDDEKKLARDNIDAVSNEEHEAHIEDTDNPHEVTAEQVGTYTKAVIDTKIAEAMSSSGRFLGSMKPSELNEIIAAGSTRMSDYAVMSEDGTVEWNGGSVDVVYSDEVVRTESGAWVIKPSASFGISVTGEMFKVVKF